MVNVSLLQIEHVFRKGGWVGNVSVSVLGRALQLLLLSSCARFRVSDTSVGGWVLVCCVGMLDLATVGDLSCWFFACSCAEY